MNTLLSIFFLLLSFAVSAQSPIVKVVSCSEKVLLDGKSIQPGMDITNSSAFITIPTGGYLGVITSSGDLYELTTSIAVKDVNAFVKKQTDLLHTTGSVKAYVPFLELPNMPELQNANMVGDSLFLYWTEYFYDIPYVVEITDAFEDPLDSVHTMKNWAVFDVKKHFVKENRLFGKVWDKRGHSEQFVLKRAVPDAKLTYDLSRLPAGELLPLYRCAVYQLYGLLYDQNFAIYQIHSRNLVINDRLMGEYYQNLSKKIKLENIKW